MRAFCLAFTALLTATVGAVACSSSPSTPSQEAPRLTTAATSTGNGGAAQGSGGSGGSSDGGAGQGGGSSGTTCPNGCPAMEYCGFADGLCGKGLLAVCLPIPNPLSCMPATAACGCDGKVYPSRCAAVMAGVDTSQNGGCMPSSSSFPCGSSFCDIDTEYCRLTTGPAMVPPFCAPILPFCGGSPTDAGPPPPDASFDGGPPDGGENDPTHTCPCILMNDKGCPMCTGDAKTGFTASGCTSL